MIKNPGVSREHLLRGGYAAGLFYLTGDIVGGIITPGYNHLRNAVSELIQSGAPDRAFLSIFLFLHAVSIIIFSIGLLDLSAGWGRKTVKVGGILLLLVGIAHGLSSSIFPQDPVGTDFTFTGILHLVLVAMTVISIMVTMPLLAYGLKPVVSWRHYHLFTYSCLAVIIISGTLTPVAIGNGLEILGLLERITAYTFYLWLAILASQIMVRTGVR